MMDAVMDTFHEFAGSPEMDGRTFVKCLKDSALLDDQRLKAVDADIIFAKYKPRGSRKIDFYSFKQALTAVARKLGRSQQQVFDAVSLAASPDYEGTSTSMVLLEPLGPERFFYDRSTYTGTHKHGGPTTAGDVITVAGLVNRDRQSMRRRRGFHPQPSQCRRSASLPTFLSLSDRQSQQSSQAVHKPFVPPTGPGPIDSQGSDGGHEDLHRHEEQELPLGPERFFYDRSTYTGTHRHGGPTVSGSGVAKDGYADLKDLVRREHVQDDALQRRHHAATSSGIRSKLSSPRMSPKASPKGSPSVSRSGSGQLPVLLGHARPGFSGEQLQEKLKDGHHQQQQKFTDRSSLGHTKQQTQIEEQRRQLEEQQAQAEARAHWQAQSQAKAQADAFAQSQAQVKASAQTGSQGLLLRQQIPVWSQSAPARFTVDAVALPEAPEAPEVQMPPAPQLTPRQISVDSMRKAPAAAAFQSGVRVAYTSPIHLQASTVGGMRWTTSPWPAAQALYATARI
eukprot:TRINITY_DN64409_c0_g1_i1.p1 TRINITY_DN64409_c0_g1~~TRINITY_DN64409_c0_g1_i1.p1  ORF type:complete len:509 (-),score=102.88 TRINITY_DN64409_c0_g1_i1:354-1880(-)